jgi:fumarate hydratase class II
MPTTIHVAASLAISGLLIPALRDMYFALKSKSVEFDHIVKTGRTHLQDAAPVRMGQVFGGFTAQSRKCIGRAHKCLDTLSEVALGGTAVGTGLNRHPDMPGIAINYLNEATGLKFKEALNHFEANSCRESMVEVSGELKTIAVSLHKIANDIRFMGSGPRNGLGELRLPAVQPGSSMMPGKVNPVMAEALIMAAAQVIGNDAAITVGGLGSYFELNMMMPLIGYNLITSIEILANAVFAFTQKCVEELEADEAHCRMLVEQSLALATPLVPVVGYEKAAEISKIAHLTGCTIKEVAIELNILPTPALEKLLDPVKMTEPGIISGDV